MHLFFLQMTCSTYQGVGKVWNISQGVFECVRVKCYSLWIFRLAKLLHPSPLLLYQSNLYASKTTSMLKDQNFKLTGSRPATWETLLIWCLQDRHLVSNLLGSCQCQYYTLSWWTNCVAPVWNHPSWTLGKWANDPPLNVVMCWRRYVKGTCLLQTAVHFHLMTNMVNNTL